MGIALGILLVAAILDIISTKEERKLKVLRVGFIILGVILGAINIYNNDQEKNAWDIRAKRYEFKIDSLNNDISVIKERQIYEILAESERFIKSSRRIDTIIGALDQTAIKQIDITNRQKKSLNEIKALQKFNNRALYTVRKSKFGIIVQVPFKVGKLDGIISKNESNQRIIYSRNQIDSIFLEKYNARLIDILSYNPLIGISDTLNKKNYFTVSITPIAARGYNVKDEYSYYFEDNILCIKWICANPFLTIHHWDYNDFSYFDLIGKIYSTHLRYEIRKPELVNSPSLSFVEWEIGDINPRRVAIQPNLIHHRKQDYVDKCVYQDNGNYEIFEILLTKDNLKDFETHAYMGVPIIQ